MTTGIPVHEAWAKVKADLGAIGKSHSAAQEMGGYRYRGVEDILDKLSPLLVEHGVTISPQILSKDISVSGSRRCTTLHVRYHIIGPAGDVLDPSPEGIGEGLSSQAQGPNIAMSNAFKTCMFQALCIPINDTTVDSEEGPEHDFSAPPAWDPKVAKEITDSWGHLPEDLAAEVLRRLSRLANKPILAPTELPSTYADRISSVLTRAWEAADARTEGS